MGYADRGQRGFLGAVVMAGAALTAASCAELAETKPLGDATAKTSSPAPGLRTNAKGSTDKNTKTPSDPCKDFRAHKSDVSCLARGGVNGLAISPDGKLLVSGSWDKTVKLWSLPDGALVKTLEGHKGSVESVAIGSDGKLLVSGDHDATVKLWSLPDGALVKTLEDRGSTARSVAIGPDGEAAGLDRQE